jgi:hypothetical protein
MPSPRPSAKGSGLRRKRLLRVGDKATAAEGFTRMLSPSPPIAIEGFGDEARMLARSVIRQTLVGNAKYSLATCLGVLKTFL